MLEDETFFGGKFYPEGQSNIGENKEENIHHDLKSLERIYHLRKEVRDDSIIVFSVTLLQRNILERLCFKKGIENV
ncbi:MAG: hypothetical protein U0586_07600 [Candidatus Brocadiaceae bacterium]